MHKSVLEEKCCVQKCEVKYKEIIQIEDVVNFVWNLGMEYLGYFYRQGCATWARVSVTLIILSMYECLSNVRGDYKIVYKSRATLITLSHYIARHENDKFPSAIAFFL